MRTNFHKFSVNSRTIDIKFEGIGAIFMGLQPFINYQTRSQSCRLGDFILIMGLR